MSTASKSILLRVTPQEHAEISLRATQSGQSLSRFLVSRALGDAPATWATTPQHEVTKAVEALKEALKVLEGVDISSVAIEREEAPVVEATVTTPVIEPEPEEDDVDPDADPLAKTFAIPDPPDLPLAGAAWVKAIHRVYYRPDRTSMSRLRATTITRCAGWECRPGAIFAALVGSTTVYVGRAKGDTVVWGEALPWRLDKRGDTLDRLQALATRDLCPSAWEDGEEDEVLPPLVTSEPEVVFVSAPGPGDLDGRDLIKWVKAVGSVDQHGYNGYAIHPPAGSGDFLRDDAEARLRPGTLLVALAQQKNGRWPVLVYGRTVSGQRHVQWNTDELLDWGGAKISTLIRLRDLLAGAF